MYCLIYILNTMTYYSHLKYKVHIQLYLQALLLYYFLEVSLISFVKYIFL